MENHVNKEVDSMKRRRCLLAVLLAGVIAAMPVTQISFAAENTGTEKNKNYR